MNWILTSTGKRFDLFEPDADMIDPRDISHSLAHLCRFNGHTREFYSVARHSCIVAELVPTDPAIWDCLVGIEPLVETIRPWSAAEARITYHQRLMDQLAVEHRRKAA